MENRVERMPGSRVPKWHYTEYETREEYARSCEISELIPDTYTAAPFELIHHRGRLALAMDYCGETLLQYSSSHPGPSKEWAMIALQTVHVFLLVGSQYEIRDCHMGNVCVASEQCLGYPCVRFIDLAQWIKPPVLASKFRTLTVNLNDLEANLWVFIPGAAPICNLVIAARARNRLTGGTLTDFVNEVMRGLYVACLEVCAPYLDYSSHGMSSGDYHWTGMFLSSMLHAIHRLLLLLPASTTAR